MSFTKVWTTLRITFTTINNNQSAVYVVATERLPVTLSQDTGGGGVAEGGGVVGVWVLNVGDENLLELVEMGITSKLVLRLKLSAGSIIDEAWKFTSVTAPDEHVGIMISRKMGKG